MCVIHCQECNKPRCIYAVKKLDVIARRKIKGNSSKVYTCGSFLFPPDSDYSSTIVQSLTCQDPVEVQYCSASTVAFAPVCYHCGAPEETLLSDNEIMELKKTVHCS